MKIYLNNLIKQYIKRILVIMLVVLISCRYTEFTGSDIYETTQSSNPSVNSTQSQGSDRFLFYFDNGGWFRMRYVNSSLGDQISSGDYLGGWDHMAGVQAGYRNFIVGHHGSKDFFIRPVSNGGVLGDRTDGGTWNSNYETFFGFYVKNRGFIFGQDSYGVTSHHWFVQEVTSFGKLAPSESDRGDWHNYYGAATPLYVGDQTYLFFQNNDGANSSEHYWFISHVSDNGVLQDVCSGYWGNFWEKVTSYNINGKTYLVGLRSLATTTENTNYGTEWFVQRINSDGTMGEETDRGIIREIYYRVTAYVTNGSGYLFLEEDDNNYGVIRKVTEDGTFGPETYRDKMGTDYDFFFPFDTFSNKTNVPDNFRYTIGWDLNRTTGVPYFLHWSSGYQGPWTGETKLGGGAAAADIDRDASHLYDLVLVGIQSLPGPDRFYYKVGWNLDKNGTAISWGNTLYGPYCGEIQEGGGAAIGDIDGNGIPDLMLMSVDAPDGANSFWYFIGWNLDTSGRPASWSDKFQVDGLGFSNAGGGVALADLDGNGKQELVLMAIDDPGGINHFWYRIGRNLDKTGKAESWTPMLMAPIDLGDYSSGGGLALADINHNGKPDLVMMNIDSPKGANPFWYYVGWDLDINGSKTGWSDRIVGPSIGNMTSGGGAAVINLNKGDNDYPEIILMTVDNPYGND